MSDIAIFVSNVSKCYRVFDNQRSRLLHAVWPVHTKGMQEVWALKDINFEIKRGESVAIIGRNGGGKSTLLEILTGTLTPTTGAVKVNGRVSALLELGSGFNPEFSGRDNVILNGLLLGLSKEDILSRFHEIEAFAEIGAAIERPVKTYSSGMMMRLAFAVQVLCDPDILIVDEALSVGDFFFQQKCLNYIRQLHANGLTLVFVSHDMQTVRDLCSKGLFIRNGEVAFWGDNLQAINHYLRNTNQNNIAKPSGITTIKAKNSTQEDYLKLSNPIWENSNPATVPSIVAVGVYSPGGEAVSSTCIGSRLDVYIQYIDDIYDPNHVTCLVKNRFGQIVTTCGTYTSGIPLAVNNCNRRTLRLSITMLIEAGEYSIQANLGKAENCSNGRILFETDWIGPIAVTWDYQKDIPPFYGLVGIPVIASFC